MIMPVSVARNYAPSFKAVINCSPKVDEAMRGFTRSESIRWNSVLEAAGKANDGKVFNISETILQIEKAVLSILTISEEKEGTIKQDLFRFTKGGSVYLYDMSSYARSIIDTFENMYKK